MAFTIEQLQPILQGISNKVRIYDQLEPDLMNICEFLMGKIHSVQPFSHSSTPGYCADFILLAKDSTVTNENKQLIYKFFQDPSVPSNIIFSVVRFLFDPYPHQMEDLLKMVDQNIDVLKSCGWSDETIGKTLHYFFRRFVTVEGLKKNDNSFFQLLNKVYKNLSPQVLKEYESLSWDDSTAAALYVHQKQTLKLYIKKNEPSEYSTLINVGVMRFALTYQKEEYLQYYHKLISGAPELDFRDVKLKFCSLLHYNDLHNVETELIPLAKQYLEELLKKESNFYEDSFSSTRYKTGFDTLKGFMPLSGWAVYLILQHEKEEGLEYINRLHRSDTVFKKPVIEMLWEQLGQTIVPLLIQQLYMKALSKWDEDSRVSTFIQLIKENINVFTFDACWQFSKYKSKKCKDAILQMLIEDDKEAEQKALNYINDKNADMRIAAARILAQLSTPAALTALKQSIRTEKDDEARNLMLEVAGDEYLSSIAFSDLAVIIEEAGKRGKLKKAFAPWLQVETLPAVYFNDGSMAPLDFVRFLFYRMSLTKTMNSDVEVRAILSNIDRTQTSPFAQKIIKLFFDNKAEAKYKYILALGALVGDEEIVEKLRSSIEKFIEEGRVKMAESAVGALALQGSNKALRWVEFFSRKYRSKKANVGAAALVALENAATELGITTHELGDRVVPDFGFDGLYKTFMVDGDEYRAFIDSNFKIAFFNEDNKKIKTIPAAADAALKDEFKAIAKEVRDIVKSQSPRLEYYLIIQRKWTYNQWQQFFLQNPVMFIYATKLLWGVFDTNEQLQQTFLCLEDTSLVNIEHDEISTEEEALIGIVHPTQLSGTVLQQWQQQIFDQKIDPVFPQLDRRKPDISEIDLTRKIIRTYEGKHMQTGSIRSTLERYGWHRSSNTDGGYIGSMHLLYFEKKLEAVIELEGVGVGYGWGGDEKLGRLYVIDKTRMTNKWDTYPKAEDDEKLVAFNQLPPIFMSEMLAAIEAIKQVEVTAS